LEANIDVPNVLTHVVTISKEIITTIGGVIIVNFLYLVPKQTVQNVVFQEQKIVTEMTKVAKYVQLLNIGKRY
jgi:chromosome condensin MukBEF MukE localization factor